MPRKAFELLEIRSLYKDPFNGLITVEDVDFFQLIFITEGKGKNKIQYKEYNFKKGTVFTIPKNQVQQLPKKFPGNGWLVAFTEEFMINYFQKQDYFRQLLIFDDAYIQPKIQLTVKQLEYFQLLLYSLRKEYESHYNDQFKEGILRSSLYTLLLNLERFKQLEISKNPPNPYPETFFRFKRLVETNCFRTRNVHDFAKELGFSSKKLNYITKQVVKKPAKDFITEIFILKVKNLLIGSDLTIKEVAFKAGFEEPTNFTKYFKRFSGQLPTDFRKMILYK